MDALLELDGVSKFFPLRRGSGSMVRAVDGVSFAVRRSETLGLVGESGCGKSTLARLALCLMPPSEGRIVFVGEPVDERDNHQLLAFRRHVQAVFQDPFASLNPRMTIREILTEPFRAHKIVPPGGIETRIGELLDLVGLGHVDLGRVPRQFSGGQLQRVAIARALALEPDLVVADEPTSALDPSIQAQIINLFLKIQRKRGVSYLIISHDLDVVGHMADWIAVMYLGVIVEFAPGPNLMATPLHPYTQALLSAAPSLRARRDPRWKRVVLPGDLPSPTAVPEGCRFHPRCSLAQDICRTKTPPLTAIEGDGGRRVACHFAPSETRSRGVEIARARVGIHTATGETV
jgi:oligopeptide/dipeptide ABC transporter ATP-binding protein